VANMNKDPDTGKSAEDQSDIQLDATLADADEQMLDAIRSRLNLQTGFPTYWVATPGGSSTIRR